MTDSRDGQTYKTVKIGSQTWMAENLNYKSGFCFDNDTSYCTKYGRLYTWATAVGKSESECGYDRPIGLTCSLPSGNIQGICPNGWHLPSEAEWEALKDYVSAQPEYTCGGNTNNIAKSVASESWWNSYNGGCNPGDQRDFPNNDTGFSAVPAGTLGVYGYDDAGYYANFWSATENSDYTAVAIYYTLDYDQNDFPAPTQ